MIDRSRYKQLVRLPEAGKMPEVRSIVTRKIAADRKKRRILLSVLAAMLFFLIADTGVYASTGATITEKLVEYCSCTANGGMKIRISFSDGSQSILTGPGAKNRSYSVYENGRIFFMLEESRVDITDEVANGNYFKYEYTDKNDIFHRIFVGEGKIESDGTYWSEWYEQYFFPQGSAVGVTSEMLSGDVPSWLVKAQKDYPMYCTER